MAYNKTNLFENAVLQEWFNSVALATTMPTLGTNFYIALCSGTKPTTDAAVDLSAHELSATAPAIAAYPNYARVPIARNNASVFTVVADVASNTAATVSFAACAGNGTTIQATWAAICLTDVEGTNDAVFYGDLTTPLSISTGVTTQFSTSTITFTEQ